MSRKAIKIDLSTFFDDERKMSCVLVDPNWKSVACLQKRVEHLFDVDSVRFLSDGCFLPPQESIEIIKFCSDIKAFVPKESLELRKARKSKKSKCIEKSSEQSGNENVCDASVQQILNDSRKKRKYKMLESNQSLSLSPKAKFSKSGDKNKFLEISNSKQEMPQPLEGFLTKNQSYRSKAGLTQDSYDDQYKKLQTSILKESKKTEIAENNVDNASEHSPRISSSTFLNESKLLEERNNTPHLSNSPRSSNPLKKLKSNTAHIYFNETGKIVCSATKPKSNSTPKNIEESKKVIIFRCPLSDVTNGTQTQKPRIFQLRSKNIAKKQIVEIQEEIILHPQSMQKDLNELSFDNKETKKSLESEQKTANDTNHIDSLNEKSSLHNTKIIDGSSTIAKIGQEGQVDANDLEVFHNEVTNSKDCIDLSIDLDEDDKEVHEEKTKTILKKNLQKEHDTTTNDESLASDIEEISEVIDLNETEENYNTTSNNSTPSISFKNIRINKILPFSSDLQSLPNTNDIIVFKVPYLNKSKNFVNTDYIAGKVDYINRRTKVLKILIIDGVSELYHIPSHFMCNLDDSQNNVKYLQLKLSDMREPKLFSMH